MRLPRRLLAFDIETIPDPDVGRRTWGFEGDDFEVVRRMVERRLEETEGRSGYPQLPHHRVVTVAVAALDPAEGSFAVGTVGGDATDERSHLEGFVRALEPDAPIGGATMSASASRTGAPDSPARSARAERAGSPEESPRLVSWNGNGFDLPVIRYRSMLHRIAAPLLYRADGDWKWNNYQGRYHEMHVDLMDVLSGYGASHRVGLGTIAELLGLPGKSFLEEGEVWENLARGREDLVREYCKLDAVETLLVYLDWELHRGNLSEAEVRRQVATVRDGLERERFAGWREVAAELDGWPRRDGQDGDRQ